MYLIQCIRLGSWKVRRLNRALLLRWKISDQMISYCYHPWSATNSARSFPFCANETLSVSLCREIDNVFGAVRTCFDHVLSKFSGFSWERILFLNSACVNMVMQKSFFYDSARECWGFKKTTFCVRFRRHVLWILGYFAKTIKENMLCWMTFTWHTFASLRLFTCLFTVARIACLLHICVKTSRFHYSIWATPK